MNAKISMVLIALIGVGLFALPQTTALFAGQHSFTNIDATGNQIECVKCHGDVQAELTNSGSSPATGTSAPHTAFKCEYCHRIEPGSASGDNGYGYAAYVNAAGTKKRTLIMTVSDFEEEKFPGSAKYPNVTMTLDTTITDIQNATGVNFMDDHGTPMAALSPRTIGDTEVLALQQERLGALYNFTSKTPIDQSSKKNQGFAPQAVNGNDSTWTLGTGSRGIWTTNFYGAGSRAVNPGSEYHAASLVSCLECHGGKEPFGHYSRVADGEKGPAQCSDCHYGSTNRWTALEAGGFGLFGGTDTGATEAHKQFATTSDGLTRQKGGASNGACIACHTHVSVDITYTKPTTYKFDSTFLSDGNTSVGAFSATGTNVTHSP